MTFGIDVSLNNDVHNEASLKLLQSLGLSAIVIRLGDGYREDNKCQYFVDLARKLGLPFGGYYVPYGGNDLQKELDTMKQVLSKYPDCKSTFVDAEWYKYASGAIVPANILEQHFWKFYLVSEADAIYTARWCVDGYFPKVGDWMLEDQIDKQRLHWFANYVKYYPPFWNYITSLGGSLDPNDNKLISIDHLPTILELIATGKPDLPRKEMDWAMWQCITYLPFKELTYWQRHLDYNLIKPEYFEKWFGELPIEPPNHEDNEMITNATVKATPIFNIRSAPSTSSTDIGDLVDGQRIMIDKEQMGTDGYVWANISVPKSGWVRSDGYVKDTVLPAVDEKAIRLDEIGKMESYITARKAELG